MKNRIQLAVLVTLPALLCTTAAQFQDAHRSPPKPPTHNEEVSIELQTTHETEAQRQIEERQIKQLRHVTDEPPATRLPPIPRLHAMLGQPGPTHASGQALIIRTRDLDPESQEPAGRRSPRHVAHRGKSRPIRAGSGTASHGHRSRVRPRRKTRPQPVPGRLRRSVHGRRELPITSPALIETNLVENTKPATDIHVGTSPARVIPRSAASGTDAGYCLDPGGPHGTGIRR